MKPLLGLAILAIAVPLGPSAYAELAPDTYARDEPSLHTVPFSTRLARASTSQVELYVPWRTGEIARVVVFIPSGYGVDLASRPGVGVGFVTVWSDFRGYVGKISADAPSAHASNSCAPGVHQAVWLLQFAIDGEKTVVPLFVDRTVGADASLGGYRVEACLPRSSDLGIRVAMLELDLDELTNPRAAGAYTWRALVTPYGGSGPDPGRTFELRSTVPLPMKLTLRARYDRTSRYALLTGRFITPGFDVGGMPVELFVKSGRYLEPVRWTRTRVDGRFSLRRRIRGRTTFAVATGAITECESSIAAPAGCVSETIAGVASAEVTVIPRRRSSVSGRRPR